MIRNIHVWRECYIIEFHCETKYMSCPRLFTTNIQTIPWLTFPILMCPTVIVYRLKVYICLSADLTGNRFYIGIPNVDTGDTCNPFLFFCFVQSIIPPLCYPPPGCFQFYPYVYVFFRFRNFIRKVVLVWFQISSIESDYRLRYWTRHFL